MWNLPCKLGPSDNISRRLNSGPKINEIRENIRQKYRERIKKARYNVFVGNRSMTKEDCQELNKNKEIVKELIRENIAELEIDIALQEQIYLELTEEANRWLIEEFEREDNHFIEIAQSKEVVFCPICQKSILQYFDSMFNCSCGIKFSFNGDENCLKNNLYGVLSDHNKLECDNQLQFFTEPKDQQNLFLLNAICLDCEFFRQIAD